MLPSAASKAASGPTPLIDVLGVENILTSDTSVTLPPAGLFSEKVNQRSYEFSNLDGIVDTMSLPNIPICRPAVIRLLCNPPTSIQAVEDRRTLITAFNQNEKLRSIVDKIEKLLVTEHSTLLTGYEEMIGNFSLKNVSNQKVETLFQDIANHVRAFVYFMPQMGRGRAHYDQIMTSIASLNEFDNPILDNLSSQAQVLRSSDDYKYINRMLWLTFKGILRPGENPRFTPRLPLTPGSLDYYSALGFLAGSGLSFFGHKMNEMSFSQDPEQLKMGYLAMIVPGCMIIATSLPKIVSSRGGERFIKAVRNSSLTTGFDLIGELLALKALADFDQKTARLGWKHAELVESPSYMMNATKLRHPLLELRGIEATPNDVNMSGRSPIVITGPNSGGKSTFVTSIFLSQLMLQNGLRTPAESATVSIADKLHYRGPLFNGMSEEGRFGAELIDTKNTLEASSRRSLVIFDEICGGTADNERLAISYSVIEAMHDLQIATLLVTHDLDLAHRLAKDELAQPMKFGLGQDGEPDFIARDGISESSYAGRIARKLKFTVEDIRRFVEDGSGAV